MAWPDTRRVDDGEIRRVLLQQQIKRVVAHAHNEVDVALIDGLVKLVSLRWARKPRRGGLAALALPALNLLQHSSPGPHVLLCRLALDSVPLVLQRLGEGLLARELRALAA